LPDHEDEEDEDVNGEATTAGQPVTDLQETSVISAGAGLARKVIKDNF